MKVTIWGIMLLTILILAPVDAAILWVKYPDPLWVNVLMMVGALTTDYLWIRSISRHERSSVASE